MGGKHQPSLWEGPAAPQHRQPLPRRAKMCCHVIPLAKSSEVLPSAIDAEEQRGAPGGSGMGGPAMCPPSMLAEPAAPGGLYPPTSGSDDQVWIQRQIFLLRSANAAEKNTQIGFRGTRAR